MRLIEPNEKYLVEYERAYELTEIEKKEGRISKHGKFFYDSKLIDIIDHMKSKRDEKKLKQWQVPSFYYFLIDKDHFIGQVTIRTRLNEGLTKFAGNISYAISPKYYRKGYGTRLLSLALEKAKELGMETVLITCDDDNIASIKVIEKNGGILMDKIYNTIDDETFLTRRYTIKL